MTDATEQFVQAIAEHQNRLLAYVYSLLGDHARAADVLQETNLVLWRKRAEFRDGHPFLPWAFAIARMQVLAHLRDRGRDRCLLDSELVEMMAAEAEREAGRFEDVRSALRRCLEAVPGDGRSLVEGHYFAKQSVAELAASLGKGLSAVKSSLLRTRRALAECIERRLRRAEV